MKQTQQLKQRWADCLEELRRAYETGSGGFELTELWTGKTDRLVGQAYRSAVEKATGQSETDISSLALIALGGYGRRHLCPYSDVDLMFLYRKTGGTANEEVIKGTFHQLWDIGLDIGHAARTPGDAILMAKEDNTSLTAMIESRFLFGDREMFNRYYNGLIDYFQNKVAAQFVRDKAEERKQRRQRYGEAVCVQEPNLKESIGALRDFNLGMWFVLMLSGAKDIEGACSRRLLCRTEAERLKQAVDYLLRLRHGLHLLSGKREDHLTFARQEALAKSLGFRDEGNRLAESTMLAEYYHHGLALRRFAETMTRRAERTLPRRGLFSIPWIGKGKQKEECLLDSLLVLRRGEIDFREFQSRPESFRSYFAEHPLRLLEMVEFLEEHRAEWSLPVCLAVEASADLIDKQLTETPEVSGRLLEMLRKPNGLGRALMAMRDTGLLHRFFPELSTMRFLVRHDFYHRYTVDEHTIRCVELLDRFNDLPTGSESATKFSEEALVSVWHRIQKPELVRLAALFHDAGKGTPEDHSERGEELVDQAAQRLGLTEEDRQLLRFLVRDHLVMAETAFRRDLEDFRIIREFAARVGSLEYLNKLLVLTYIDISAVSPGMMTPWKAGLLWQLYQRTRQVLLGEPTVESEDLQRKRQALVETLSPKFGEELVQRHIEQMPQQYVLYTSAGIVERHLNTVQKYSGERVEVAIRFLDLHEIEADDSKSSPEDTIEVIVCTQDRLGLFRDLARCFHLENFHIISARLFTRKDGTVVDTVVAVNAMPNTAVGESRQMLLTERLQKALEPNSPAPQYTLSPLPEHRELSSVDLGRMSFQTEIDLLNDISEDYSLIELEAVDQPALLETIAACLTEKGLNIRFARMQKLGIRVVQAFYITGSEGGKISDEYFMNVVRPFLLRYVDPKTFEERGTAP